MADTASLMTYDENAERSVIAACMLSKDALVGISSSVEPRDFHVESNRLVFEAIKSLDSEGLPVDMISVADRMRTNGTLEAAGGRFAVFDIAENTISLIGWERHADIVRRDSMLRRLYVAGSELRAISTSGAATAEEAAGIAESIVSGATETIDGRTLAHVGSIAQEAVDALTAMACSGGSSCGASTGLKDVDSILCGTDGGDVAIIAARPGVGKTSFALNIAVNAAKSGVPVAFFSLEMSSVQLVDRMICSESHVSLSDVRAGRLTQSHWSEISRAAGTVSGLCVYIDDSPSLTVAQLRSKVRCFSRMHPGGIVFVDYLQLMDSGARQQNRCNEVAEISRGVKMVAKECSVPVFALSQLSRAVESRASKRPMLSDLRESGSIEQDADVVMFIDRSMDEAEAEADGRPAIGTAEIIVAKHRNGSTGCATVGFDVSCTRFFDLVREYGEHYGYEYE